MTIFVLMASVFLLVNGAPAPDPEFRYTLNHSFATVDECNAYFSTPDGTSDRVLLEDHVAGLAEGTDYEYTIRYSCSQKEDPTI